MSQASSTMTWEKAIKIMSGNCTEEEYHASIDAAQACISDSLSPYVQGIPLADGQSLYDWVGECTFCSTDTLERWIDEYTSYQKGSIEETKS